MKLHPIGHGGALLPLTFVIFVIVEFIKHDPSQWPARHQVLSDDSFQIMISLVISIVGAFWLARVLLDHRYVRYLPPTLDAHSVESAPSPTSQAISSIYQRLRNNETVLMISKSGQETELRLLPSGAKEMAAEKLKPPTDRARAAASLLAEELKSGENEVYSTDKAGTHVVIFAPPGDK